MSEFEKLQELKIIQTKGHWKESLPETWRQYFAKVGYEEVAYGLHVRTHRWYETSIDVIKIHERFLGIRYITNMFSESQDWEDCYVQIEFMEMKEVQITSYEPISKS